MVNDSADVTSSGRSFQVCGPATGDRLPTNSRQSQPVADVVGSPEVIGQPRNLRSLQGPVG